MFIYLQIISKLYSKSLSFPFILLECVPFSARHKGNGKYIIFRMKSGMWVYCRGMWDYCTGMWDYCTGMWVYCSIKVGFCLFFLLLVLFFCLFFVFDFCNYLFFLYEQNVHIYCSKILAQLILATYFKHIGVPVKEVISLLWSVIPA